MSCQIFIDGSSANFFPGNFIRGRVAVHFTSKTDIREIRLKFRGREHTYWTKRESYYDSSSKSTKYRTVHYSGDNKFVMSQLNLAGGGYKGPGRFEYPFEFILPNECPGSFNAPHGSVRYYLKATVDIPWAPDYDQEVTFNVVSPIDFNKLSSLIMTPTQYQDEKFVCCCCCASGPITLDVYLDKEAYILGDTIRIRVHVLNMSNESVEALTARLTMTIKETTTSPRHDTKYNEELIAALRETGVGAHGDRDYDLSLTIPPSTVLPNFVLCSLFEQWCNLKVEIELPACHADMEVRNVMTLGHVPLLGPGVSQPVYVEASPYSPPLQPVDSCPPPYPAESMAPAPYPADSMASAPYPINSKPSNGKDLPGVHMPVPMPMPTPGPFGSSTSTPYQPGGDALPPYPPAPAANAPPEEEAPSAPPKAPLAEGDDDWELLTESSVRPVSGPPEPSSSSEPLPPTYHEAIAKNVFPPVPGFPK